MRITDINIYPLKSAAGVSVQAAAVTASGFAFDRQWMVVDADLNFVTQREKPKLALLRPRLGTDELVLAAPSVGEIKLSFEGGAPVDCQLFGETCRALMTSPEAGEWISDYLGMSAFIVARDHGFLRRGGVQYPQRDEKPTSFVDNYGILIISRASLSDLNGRLSSQVPMDRFRPNIVVDDLSPYQEEDTARFSTSSVSLTRANVCTRCVMTNIDQTTGLVGREPFKTLSSYRFDEAYKGVRFGGYVVVSGGIGETMRVGDELVASA